MENNNFDQKVEMLTEDIDRRVVDKILEPTNAELLKKLIRNADDLNEAISIAELGTTYKRTGLHFDKRLEKMSSEIKYFKKNETLSFHTDDSKPTHKLVIGDNYEALQNLLIQYKGLVDVIYIDPPYGKDSMGEFANTNYQNAISRDNLLSMLYPRLLLAKQMLASTGAIFCSIDYRNQAYLKCLLDEIFGENNFVGTLVWRKKSGGGQTDDFFVTEHEYILVYRKTSQFKWLDYSEDAKESEFKYDDHDGKGKYSITKLEKWGNSAHKEDRETMYFPIFDPDGNEFYPIAPDKAPGRWRVGADRMNKLIAENGIYWRKDASINRWIPYEKKYYAAAKGKLQKSRSILYNFAETGTATKLLTSIFSKKDSFDNPKPIELIDFILDHVQCDIILDFFAGSGTTGHAALEKNIDDEERLFILCQINEKTDKNPHGIALDVTAPRLKRVMTGSCYPKSKKYPFYTGTSDFDWIKENAPYGGNLEVIEIESVADFETTPGKTPFDVIDETLYGLKKFENAQDKIKWVCTNFRQTRKSLIDKEI